MDNILSEFEFEKKEIENEDECEIRMLKDLTVKKFPC